MGNTLQYIRDCFHDTCASNEPDVAAFPVFEDLTGDPSDKTRSSKKIPRFTILHYSPFKACWDWLVLLLVIYTAILTPYSAAFMLRSGEQGSQSYKNPTVVVDLLVDIMFLFDIVINFRTTYVDQNLGEVISASKKIALHYLKSWFIIDAIAAIPFDLIQLWIEQDETTTKALGLLKTARLLRMVRVARKVDRYSQYAPAVLILLMCTFALIAHWMACIFYAIGKYERGNLHAPISWLDQLSEDLMQPYVTNMTDSGPSMKSKYITALYFTLTTVTTVGFGNVAANTDGEKVFCICAMLLGALMYACVFGNVTAIIERLYSGMTKFHQQMQLLKEFIKFHQIPSPLNHKLQDYYKHSWSFTNGMDINEVMLEFPDYLQADVCVHLNRKLLDSCEVFKDASEGCRRLMSTKFKTTHTAPSDIIVHRGDALNSLYFIARGSIEVLDADGDTVILGNNDIFGENICRFVTPGRSKADVKALTYCDLHMISRDDLNIIFSIYQEFSADFEENLQLSYDLRDEAVDMNNSGNYQYRNGSQDNYQNVATVSDDEIELSVVNTSNSSDDRGKEPGGGIRGPPNGPNIGSKDRSKSLETTRNKTLCPTPEMNRRMREIRTDVKMQPNFKPDYSKKSPAKTAVPESLGADTDSVGCHASGHAKTQNDVIARINGLERSLENFELNFTRTTRMILDILQNQGGQISNVPQRTKSESNVNANEMPGVQVTSLNGILDTPSPSSTSSAQMVHFSASQSSIGPHSLDMERESTA